MGKYFKGLMFVGMLAASDFVMAQALPPGWGVGWGVEAVPIGPWANLMIGLMLVAAAYAFLRKRAGAGLMALGAAVLTGGLALNTDKLAQALPLPITDFLITTPSGYETINCLLPGDVPTNTAANGVTPVFTVKTTVAGGVTLVINRLNFPPSVPVPPGECVTGTHLNPGGSCNLTCPLLF